MPKKSQTTRREALGAMAALSRDSGGRNDRAGAIRAEDVCAGSRHLARRLVLAPGCGCAGEEGPQGLCAVADRCCRPLAPSDQGRQPDNARQRRRQHREVGRPQGYRAGWSLVRGLRDHAGRRAGRSVGGIDRLSRRLRAATWRQPDRIGQSRAPKGDGRRRGKGRSGRKPVPAAAFKVNEKDRAWVDAQCTPHPLAAVAQKIEATGARETIARKTYIRATGWDSPVFDQTLARMKTAPGWKTYEVMSGHDVMLDQPDRWSKSCLRWRSAAGIPGANMSGGGGFHRLRSEKRNGGNGAASPISTMPISPA